MEKERHILHSPVKSEDDALNCPNCGAEMDRQELEGSYGRNVEVDLCFSCHLLWLDKRESLHLSPKGTLELFRTLHEHGEDARQALGNSLKCPRCSVRLNRSSDIGKAGRFSYFACTARHGRLTPFSEFLKEKQFVRALWPAEQERVRAELKQVQCSGCGAPVDLVRGFECGHCGSPITVLDADAVEKTLRELGQASQGLELDGPPEEREARARALASMETMRTDPDDYYQTFTRPRRRRGGGLGVDLLTSSLEILFRSL